MSLRDRIRARVEAGADRKHQDILYHGELVRVAPMTARDKVTMGVRITDEEGRTDGVKLWQELLVRCCYDPETNEPVFRPEDAEWLILDDAEAVEPLVDAAMRLNGLTGQAVEEAAKNSESTPTSDSSSN